MQKVQLTKLMEKPLQAKSPSHNTVLLMQNPDNLSFITIPKLFAVGFNILSLVYEKQPLAILEQDETDTLRYYSSVKTEEQYAERCAGSQVWKAHTTGTAHGASTQAARAAPGFQ